MTRSVSAIAKTGYSVRINFENMLRLAQAVSSCALWRSVDLEPVAPRTILDDDLAARGGSPHIHMTERTLSSRRGEVIDDEVGMKSAQERLRLLDD